VVEVLARAPSIHWLPDDSNDTSSQGRRHVRFPLPPTGVGGRVTGWIAAAPDVFRPMPTPLQPTISYRCIRPAGSGWLRSRLEGVPISFERFATVAVSSTGGIRIGLDDGSERTVDHVLLGTGYTIDVSRYSFLSRALLEQLDLEAGYPILGAGLESSVPGLHFLGAPAALSFGPV